MADLMESMRHALPFVRVRGDTVLLHFEGECIQSAMSQQSPIDLVVPYTKTMMGFLMANPQPERILIIGLGGGSLVKFCHFHLPNTQITAVDISPEVISLRNLFKIPDDDERLRVICMDGADFVRETNEDFDVILVDGFDALGQSAQLATREFYRSCLHKLKSKGVFVANLDNDHPTHAAFLLRAAQTFGIGSVEILVPERSNSVFFARKDLPITSLCMGENLRVVPDTTRTSLTDEFQRILDIWTHLEAGVNNQQVDEQCR